VHDVRTDLGGDLGDHLLRPSRAHRQPRTALAQLAVERVQRLEHPGGASWGAEATAQQHGIEDEEREDLIVVTDRLGERREVVHTQIPAHPHDRCGHRRCLRRERCLG
jgi:hypothetical protein